MKSIEWTIVCVSVALNIAAAIYLLRHTAVASETRGLHSGYTSSPTATSNGTDTSDITDTSLLGARGDPRFSNVLPAPAVNAFSPKQPRPITVPLGAVHLLMHGDLVGAAAIPSRVKSVLNLSPRELEELNSVLSVTMHAIAKELSPRLRFQTEDNITRAIIPTNTVGTAHVDELMRRAIEIVPGTRGRVLNSWFASQPPFAALANPLHILKAADRSLFTPGISDPSVRTLYTEDFDKLPEFYRMTLAYAKAATSD